MAPVAKRRKLEQVDAITFDPEARQEYLTGFHKRKLQRKENAKEAARKREKEERLEERRQIREKRKEDLEKHVAEVNAELRKQNPDISDNDSPADVKGEDVTWDDIEDAAPEVAQDEEYVDEDKYTTVTVEAMGDSEESETGSKQTAAKPGTEMMNGNTRDPKKRIWSKENQTKAKKKKFRYESKAERSATRQKQKSKNHAAKLRREGK